MATENLPQDFDETKSGNATPDSGTPESENMANGDGQPSENAEIEKPKSEELTEKSQDSESKPKDDEDKEPEPPKTVGEAIKRGFSETIDTFKAFVHAPREIIGVNIINVFEGMAYFGILTYLVLFMTKNVLVTDAPYVDITKTDSSQFMACLDPANIGGCIDVHAGWIVSGFLMLITFSQLFLGGMSDRLGPKKMLGISIFMLLIARVVMGFSEMFFGPLGTGIGSVFFFVVVVCLLFSALAYGVFNPAIYSITRMYSDKKTSAVSYAMLYAGMNLGAFFVGLLLPHIRRLAGDTLMDSSTFVAGDVISSIQTLIPDFKPRIVLEQGLMAGTNGYSGALIFIAGIMVIVFMLYVVFIARSKTKPLVDPSKDEEGADKPKTDHKLSFIERLKTHPLADLKFDFFIFILIPVQTLFAYQNILIPTYLERSFRDYPTIYDNFETFSNINPLIVFIFAPVIAALTARQNVYKMMIVGTTVMAAPTFLLSLGTTPTLFLTYIMIGSIGESIWQPRFLQHVTQIAPKERMGAYVGIANLPWFLTKFIVGLYVGFFMQGYIPDPDKFPNAAQNPQGMWLIFAFIAIISPVALFLARKWCNVQNPDEAKKSA